MVAEAVEARGRSHAASVLVGLLALAIFINYVDRGNLATAAPLIKGELALDNFQIGLLTSAFFWTYTPSQFLAAWLADRLNPYRALALGFAVWSAATALTGLAGSFASILMLRCLLGLGESAAFPCCSKLMARHIAPSALGVANGFVQTGIALGPAVGTLAGGLLIAQYGWRLMFVVFGGVALLWLWPWLGLTRNLSEAGPKDAVAAPPSFARLLSLRAMWGAMLGHFSANYILYFLLSWLPLYLVRERGFNIAEMAQLGALIYAVQGASAVPAGWLADRWIASGASLNRVRKTCSVVGHIGSATCMAGVALGDQTTAIVCLLLSGVWFALIGTSLWSTTQTLAGPVAAARWVGLQNCVANVAGIVAPLITGFIADRTGSFAAAFAVASAITLAGAVGWGLVVPRVEPVRWDAA
jgi:MFS family permease